MCLINKNFRRSRKFLSGLPLARDWIFERIVAVPRPLQKRSRHGEPYTRPPAIEAALAVALEQDLDTLLERAAIRDTATAGFLPSECLVHLIREAVRADDDRALDKLVPVLFKRCEAVLMSKVPDSMPHAQEIRAEVLGRFAELIGEDADEPDRGQLDFFEMRFGAGFRALRITVQREHCALARREIVVADPFGGTEEPIDDTPEERGVDLDEKRLAMLEQLPEKERKALVLHYLNGLPIESEDPKRTTVATRLGVTGRTIRNLLARARARLVALEKKT